MCNSRTIPARGALVLSYDPHRRHTARSPPRIQVGTLQLYCWRVRQKRSQHGSKSESATHARKNSHVVLRMNMGVWGGAGRPLLSHSLTALTKVTELRARVTTRGHGRCSIELAYPRLCSLLRALHMGWYEPCEHKCSHGPPMRKPAPPAVPRSQCAALPLPRPDHTPPRP